MFYRLQFINSPRFMTSLLLNPVNNLSKGVYKVNCKNRHDGKNSNICWIKYKYCNYFLEYTFFKDGLIKHKCLCCNKNYKQKFDEKLKEQFSIHSNFLITRKENLFYCCVKVFTLMNIRMIGKDFMKQYCLKKKTFTVT